MDTDYAIDLGAVFEVIDSAQIIIFRFVTIPQRLLFDACHTEMAGSFLKAVPRATSLEGSGVRKRIQGRMAKAGYPRLAAAAEEVLQELCQQERAEMINAITGAGYRALWERRA